MEIKTTKDYLIQLLSLRFNDKQKSFYQWLLDNSTLFTNKDIVSPKIQSNYLYDIKSAKAKGCYYNAQLCALNKEEVEYFEGYYIHNDIPLPLEHAFNVVNNKVLDITSLKFNFDVKEWFGIKIPKEFYNEKLLKFKVSDSWLSAFYFEKIYGERNYTKQSYRSIKRTLQY